MKKYSRVYASIDLDSIVHNLTQLQSNMLKKQAKMMAVIKADGYGHGAIPIAKVLEEIPFVWGYAAATAEEAFLIRKSGIKKPILILGYTFPEHYEELIDLNITQTIFEEKTAKIFSKIALDKGKTAKFHIAIDTGMSRIGFTPNQESLHIIKEIVSLPNVKCEGIFTHFAKADEVDKTFSYKQQEIFLEFLEKLENQGISFVLKHSSNSAGIIDLPNSNMDLVRSGISLYGMYPSDEVEKNKVFLKQALSLKSHVIYVKDVPVGAGVSYGSTYITERPMKIATVPVGYADGYPRSLSNQGYVLIHGKKSPILGRVCMDQFMVDVTHIEQVMQGDIVTLIGQDKEEHITVEELAEISKRFNYEFVCDLGKRIPRIYLKDGKIVEQIDYFKS